MLVFNAALGDGDDDDVGAQWWPFTSSLNGFGEKRMRMRIFGSWSLTRVSH